MMINNNETHTTTKHTHTPHCQRTHLVDVVHVAVLLAIIQGVSNKAVGVWAVPVDNIGSLSIGLNHLRPHVVVHSDFKRLGGNGGITACAAGSPVCVCVCVCVCRSWDNKRQTEIRPACTHTITGEKTSRTKCCKSC